MLRAIPIDTYPIAVARFFETATSDLESDLFDAPVSPRDWLLAGLSADAVAELAAGL